MDVPAQVAALYRQTNMPLPQGSNITPAMSILMSGFVQNQGLALTQLNATLLPLSQQSIIAAARSAIDIAVTETVSDEPILKNLGSTLENGSLSSVVPDSLTDAYFNDTSDLISSIQFHANYVLCESDIGAFAQVFSQGQAYINQAYNIIGSASTSNAMSFKNFGTDITDHTSLTNFGLQSLIINPTTEKLQAFGNELGLVAALFQLTNVELFGTERGFIQTLIDKNIDVIDVNALLDMYYMNEITYEYEESNPRVRTALSTISDADFKRIVARLSVTLPDTVTTLLDIFELPKLLPKTHKTLNFVSLNEFARKVQYLPNFATFSTSSLATLISGIEIQNVNISLDVVPPADANILQASVGPGSGKFGNPIYVDLFGTLIGHNFTNHIDVIVSSLNKIAVTSSGIALLDAYSKVNNLMNGVYDPVLPATTYDVPGVGSYASRNAALQAIKSYIISCINTVITQCPADVALASTEYLALAQYVETERTFFVKASINPTNAIRDNKVMASNFVSKVSSLAEFNDFGAAEFFAQLAAPNMYGEALKAVQTESRNISLLKNSGATPSNYIKIN